MEQKRFLWFKKWITEGYSIREIAQMYELVILQLEELLHIGLNKHLVIVKLIT